MKEWDCATDEMYKVRAYVPDTGQTNQEALASVDLMPVYKTHEPPDKDRMPEIIYLKRDPVDALWSHYIYQKERHGFGGDIEDFLYGRGEVSRYARHIRAYKKMRELSLFVQYKELLQNFEKEVERIAYYLMLDLREGEIEQIRQETAFDSMEEMANKHKPLEGVNFIRKGVTGDGRKNMPEELQNRIDSYGI